MEVVATLTYLLTLAYVFGKAFLILRLVSPSKDFVST